MSHAMHSYDPKAALSCDHLVGIENLGAGDIQLILDTGQHIADQGWHRGRYLNDLDKKTVINLFIEHSTRTLTSFELAARRLGADVVTIPVSSSSIKKGESLIDTALTLGAMRPDFLVLRHKGAGVADWLARELSDCALINGGDGAHEHPTQALLDALVIRQHKGRIAGLRILICGDILHSRVARSNILLLGKMGAEIRIVAPATLLPTGIETMQVKVFHDLVQALEGCDIVMVLRLQHERMSGTFVPSLREYYHFFGINRVKLQAAKPDILVMHPGPIHRGVEIASDIADDVTRSLISRQVEMGVCIRMACLQLLHQRMSHKK
ncbi:MAG: aspartate carbamoyltransferase catalytic subunit [Pseudomonadota bacterium]